MPENTPSRRKTLFDLDPKEALDHLLLGHIQGIKLDNNFRVDQFELLIINKNELGDLVLQNLEGYLGILESQGFQKLAEDLQYNPDEIKLLRRKSTND